MKNGLIFLLLLAVAPAWGQVVDGVNLAEKKEVTYVELVGQGKLFSTKLTVVVDYGQKFDWSNNQKVEGADGKPIVFNSMMDAVNQFAGWGWELMFAYDVNNGSGGTVYHYVLKRKAQ